MATNRKHKDGLHLALTVSNPATPVSGGPVRIGKLTGVAIVDEGEGGNTATQTTVDMSHAVWSLLVDDDTAAGITPGTVLYYHDTATGSPTTTNINNKSVGADAVFGFALGTLAANATGVMDVLHIPQAQVPDLVE